jgi:hypothetical protein
MPDADTAIRAFNGLRRDLPLLVALAANSPFRHGRDTGLASAREVSLREWPRSGVPRAMRDFADFCEMSRVLTRAADVPDYTYFWWSLRPHPRLGTVEIRALDAQTSLADTAALVALVHCLAREAAESEPCADPQPEVIAEGMFRAARFGLHGQLPDAHGTRHAVPKILEDALARVESRARELGCVEELTLLPELVRRGGGAGAQRATHEIAGIDALVRQLTELTAAGAIWSDADRGVAEGPQSRGQPAALTSARIQAVPKPAREDCSCQPKPRVHRVGLFMVDTVMLTHESPRPSSRPSLPRVAIATQPQPSITALAPLRPTRSSSARGGVV